MGSRQRLFNMKAVFIAVIIVGLISSSYSLKCATCNGDANGNGAADGTCIDADDNGESKDCDGTCFASRAAWHEMKTWLKGCHATKLSDHCNYDTPFDSYLWESCYCNSDNCNADDYCAQHIECELCEGCQPEYILCNIIFFS